MSSITPTVGRKVYLWVSSTVLNLHATNVHDEKQPIDASICFVHDDGTINVGFVDHEGEPGRLLNLAISDPTGEEVQEHAQDSYCTWMPYQVSQVSQAAAAKPSGVTK